MKHFLMKSAFENRQEELLTARRAGVLPRIDIAGDEFVVNWLLRELHAINDYNVRISFREMTPCTSGYVCFYHKATKKTVYIREDISNVPADTMMLEIPDERMLDPVGVARSRGLAETALLAEFPIRENLAAKVTPLLETGLGQFLRAGRGNSPYKP